MQPRDRGDWISGIRRAVDLSSGGQLDQGETRLNADDDDDGGGGDGASPNSHKHFFPYMGFCASIWGNVRHHCHHHHHHHHIQKSKSINTVACLIAH